MRTISLIILLFALFAFVSFGVSRAQTLEDLHEKAEDFNDAGKFTDALKVYRELLPEAEKKLGKTNPDYIHYLHRYTIVLRHMRNFGEAEPLMNEVIELYLKNGSKDSLKYALYNTELATLYQDAGRYEQALPMLTEAKEIIEKTTGKETVAYINACNNLATVTYLLEKIDEAEKLFREGREVAAKVKGKESKLYANLSANLAEVLKKNRQYDKAAEILKEAIEIDIKVFGKEHPFYGYSCNNLAQLYKTQARYAEAEPYFFETKDNLAKTLGKEHLYYAFTCTNLGETYQLQGRFDEAFALYKEAASNFHKQIEVNFGGLTEREKGQFFKLFKEKFEFYYTLALQNPTPEIAAWLLENNSVVKALLFFSTNKLLRFAENSDSREVKSSFLDWSEKRKQLSKAFEMGESKRKEQKLDLKKLMNEANDAEKKLSLIAQKNGLQTQLTPKKINWQDLKKNLNKDEALIEISRIRVSTTQGFTDSIAYVALILKPEYKSPEMIVLSNGKDLEGKNLTYYRNCIRIRKTDEVSFNAYFKVLFEKISGCRKLYFSADGVYFQINPATLYVSEKKKYLADLLDIQLLTSARDLLLSNAKKETKKLNADYKVWLFGYPDYSGESIGAERSTERSQRLTVLPGTKREIEAIATLADRSGIKTKVFLQENATEENLKKAENVKILHVATHGFFVSEVSSSSNQKSDEFDNPMMRSGLLLTGAENGLNDKEYKKENGVLTAQEAINLDLRGTELVVLSACETGLGTIVHGEGVFGLQRAFREAGAESVLMSLWKVDDKATEEMMQNLYENLFLKKQDKRTAFLNAQEKLRQTYQSPYYWGAFVMTGH
jgi:CHAT domain-containing protein